MDNKIYYVWKKGSKEPGSFRNEKALRSVTNENDDKVMSQRNFEKINITQLIISNGPLTASLDIQEIRMGLSLGIGLKGGHATILGDYTSWYVAKLKKTKLCQMDVYFKRRYSWRYKAWISKHVNRG